MNYAAAAKSALGSAVYDALSQEVARYFGFIIFISFWANILMLTPTLYMLQVFDRFLISKNVFTLVAVTIICSALYIFLFFAEWLRSKVIIRAGISIDEALNKRIFRAAFAQSMSSQIKNPGQSFADLGQVRQFVTGNGAIALTDVPWIPVYVFIAFFLHPILGATVLLFVASLFAMTWIYRRYLEGDEVARVEANIDAGNYLQLKLRNAEAISAHGMLSRLTARWERML
jgi:ATP-binding cassette subfamily C exporter for protease/lipase